MDHCVLGPVYPALGRLALHTFSLPSKPGLGWSPRNFSEQALPQGPTGSGTENRRKPQSTKKPRKCGLWDRSQTERRGSREQGRGEGGRQGQDQGPGSGARARGAGEMAPGCPAPLRNTDIGQGPSIPVTLSRNTHECAHVSVCVHAHTLPYQPDNLVNKSEAALRARLLPQA